MTGRKIIMSRVGMWMLAAAVAASPAAAQNDSGLAGKRYTDGSREGWLGMGLSCSQCSFDLSGRRDGGGRWTFSAPPSVFSVDDNGPADRAGLRAGDTLLAIDGVPLTTAEGGAAFGSVRPGQKVALRYRRGGADLTASLTAESRPARDDTYQLTRQLQQLQRQWQRQQAEATAEAQRQMEQAQRHMAQTQTQLQLQQQYLQQVLQQMEQARAASPAGDSTQLESLRLYAQQLDSAAARWREADSAYAVLAAPAPPPAAVAPPAPLAAMAPTAPLAATAPTAPLAAMAPSAPLAAAGPVPPIPPGSWHRDAGPVRYSGRLGDVIIEARGNGAVTTTEASDSVVVVTSRDVSVRIALRPARTPRPRAATRAPAAAPAPRPPQP
jgi:PDZ domain-containing protein